MSGDKVLGRGSPVRQSQVQQLRVDALKDSGIAIELGNGFIWRPVVEACEGSWVLLGLELGSHHRHQDLLGQPACLHAPPCCCCWLVLHNTILATDASFWCTFVGQDHVLARDTDFLIILQYRQMLGVTTSQHLPPQCYLP